MTLTPTAAPVVEALELDVSGMTCAACAGRVERALNKLEGVTATVNYATERAVITGLPLTEAPRAIQQVENAGYGAHVREGADDTWSARATENRITSLRRRLVLAALLTVPLMDLTIVLALVPGWRFPGWEWVCVLLALPIVTWAAWPFHRATLRNLRHGMVSMDTLVSLGIAASFGWAVATLLFGLGDDQGGYWLGFGLTPAGANSIYLDVAAGMTTFQLAGRYFETRSRRKAGDVLGALNALAATHVRVLRDSVETIEPAGTLRTGDVFIVLPGETIPADGIVRGGTAAVDASMMTGEPLPAAVAAGDDVTGGTISTDGRLEITATAVGAHTRLAQMAALTDQAQARKARVQTLVDRVVTWFVPVVIVLAVIVATAWALAGTPLQQAFGIGISVLIIACPCALGLATPTALMVGIGRAASLGILIKGHDALEASGRVDTVVLDKTGTLTTGRMSVESATAYGVPEHELWRIAASVERGSEHAIARAIENAATRHVTDLLPLETFTALPGLGAEADIAAARVLIGNAELLRTRGIDITRADTDLGAAAENGRTVVLVARDGELIGAFQLADTLKPYAAETITALRSQGLHTVLLTGDSPAAGRQIADTLSIDQVHAGVMPTTKADVIRDLQAQGRRVAMVGDGINDATALATADLGLALVAGTDIALKAADIILVREDLLVVPDALTISRRTLRTIRTNLIWAFGYNVAAIPIAAAGLLNPLIAAAAMSLSSVLVVYNSLRIQRVQGSGRGEHSAASTQPRRG
ncbi:MAG TPA: heavy metal translocating P-type ATPase [Microbacterium sp.]|uniref:heavy metal translocating P-type ATPase n=1 Tax=Microbacterium sp. UBA1097 TaxID=1946941 RepID=UPI000E8E13E3|nr:heavy metal translocating P-type ATPase [Microbacterium sp. UBA1097]HAJ17791.1 heavy metal translocating P-type ATPase [Microbacterium sp.]HBS75052.1 heavy metal translocating P-type ATPase [Microbacterium sp.]HCM50901.1 heavy metal translocating P-type ATPase [Microbacterium sp.]|tara:strand:- start:3712 stop:6003 length:2292 start_codon:yes stop_codon:yes gene_type:complete